MEDQVPNVRSDCACVAAAPLGWPVVPDVKIRSERSSGSTAAARAADDRGIDALARLQEVVQSGHGHGPRRQRRRTSPRSFVAQEDDARQVAGVLARQHGRVVGARGSRAR